MFGLQIRNLIPQLGNLNFVHVHVWRLHVEGVSNVVDDAGVRGQLGCPFSIDSPLCDTGAAGRQFRTEMDFGDENVAR